MNYLLLIRSGLRIQKKLDGEINRYSIKNWQNAKGPVQEIQQSAKSIMIVFKLMFPERARQIPNFRIEGSEIQSTFNPIHNALLPYY